MEDNTINNKIMFKKNRNKNNYDNDIKQEKDDDIKIYTEAKEELKDNNE